jgi:hypothetical protein
MTLHEISASLLGAVFENVESEEDLENLGRLLLKTDALIDAIEKRVAEVQRAQPS